MRKLYLIAIAILITMSFIVVPAMAKTPDGNTPAEETVCDDAGLIGAAWGLCNAYCEAMDCDNNNPNASDKACDKIFDQIVTLIGEVPPCEDLCPDDPDKTDPGICGCGTPDTDSDGDGIPDCIDPYVPVCPCWEAETLEAFFDQVVASVHSCMDDHSADALSTVAFIEYMPGNLYSQLRVDWAPSGYPLPHSSQWCVINWVDASGANQVIETTTHDEAVECREILLSSDLWASCP